MTSVEKLALFCDPASRGAFSSMTIEIIICYDKYCSSKSKSVHASYGIKGYCVAKTLCGFQSFFVNYQSVSLSKVGYFNGIIITCFLKLLSIKIGKIPRLHGGYIVAFR
jgi:hypothetical protein